MGFLRNFRLDQNSFWVGFLAASLFWWLVRILRPLLSRFRQSFSTQKDQVHWDTRTIIEIRLRNETLRQAQSAHLASPLFSLDEIILPPRLLAPGLPPNTTAGLTSQDITESLIPETPDWPQMASFYHWPSLTLEEALSGNANLAILGQPGAGKSVALAHLASQLARKEITLPGIDSPTPIYIHACDLVLPPISPDTLNAPILDALANYVSQQTFSKLPPFLEGVFHEGRAVLVLDGLDELDPSNFDLAVDYLEELLQSHQTLRIITAISNDYWGKLPQMGFQIISLEAWTQPQFERFLDKWAVLWKQHFSSQTNQDLLPDPDLIKGWLATSGANLTPLEFVCKTWAAFAGDTLGSKAVDALEAYLRRKLHSLSERERRALEHIAGQMMISQQPVAEKEAIDRWLGGHDEFKELLDVQIPDSAEVNSPTLASGSSEIRVRKTSAMMAFTECGILRSHPKDRYSISHPVWSGFLASRSLDASIALPALVIHKNWDARNLTMQFLSSDKSADGWIAGQLQKEGDTLLPRFLLQTSRWLPYAPEDSSWVPTVLRALANELNRQNGVANIQARIIAALVGSTNPGVALLLRQLLKSRETDLTRLAALGLGMLHDVKAVEDIEKIQGGHDLSLASASLLSLTAIGNKPALDSVAATLLHGSEPMRRFAAEAFANHTEEGHPILKEASAMEDLSVRRAAVFGLARVKQPWADDIIESLRTTDTQWVVQDAANQAVAMRTDDSLRAPFTQPELNQQPWLIEFAASRGLGIAPGQPAVDMLYSALEQGDSRQKLSALDTISQHAEIAVEAILENSFQDHDLEIRQAAAEVIWRLQACGLDF